MATDEPARSLVHRSRELPLVTASARPEFSSLPPDNPSSHVESRQFALACNQKAGLASINDEGASHCPRPALHESGLPGPTSHEARPRCCLLMAVAGVVLVTLSRSAALRTQPHAVAAQRAAFNAIQIRERRAQIQLGLHFSHARGLEVFLRFEHA